MGSDSTSSPLNASPTALKGIHGVQLMCQSPYIVEGQLCRDINLSNTGNSQNVEASQRLLFQ